MGWSWHDYLMTPRDVIEAVVSLAQDEQRAIEKALKDAKRGR